MLAMPYIVIAEFAWNTGASYLAILWVVLSCVAMTALEISAIFFLIKQKYM